MKRSATWTIVAASQRKPGHSAFNTSIVALLHGKVEVTIAEVTPCTLVDGTMFHLQHVQYIDTYPTGDTKSLYMVVAAAQAVAGTWNTEHDQIHITVVDINRKTRSRIFIKPLPDNKLRSKWLSAVLRAGPDLSRAEKALISKWASSWKIERIDTNWKCMLEGK